MGSSCGLLFKTRLSRFKHFLIIFWALAFLHQIKAIKLFQSVINKRPRAVFLFINFAFSSVGTAAWAVNQPLMAACDRAYAGGQAQNTLAALRANLRKFRL